MYGLSQTLYLCATLPVEDALPLWGGTIGRRDLSQLSWSEFRLLPLVRKNLELAQRDYPRREELRQAYFFFLTKNASIRKKCMEAVEALQHQDVPVVLLKGMVLIEEVYQDSGIRPCFDLDILA